MTLMAPAVNVAPSSIPDDNDSHAAVKVALGHHIESNCMMDSPFNRGFADKEL